MSTSSLHRDAKLVALLLENDLVMARLVKEHIKPERLIEILEIPTPEPEALDLSDALAEFTEDDLKEELANRRAKNKSRSK